MLKMNSSFRSFNLILVGAIVLAFVLVLLYSFRVEPLEGDLTRVGGFNEYEYGWTEPQQFFKEEFLFKWLDTLDDWNRPYDVFVIGDSFGWRPHNSFVSQLVDRTGWSVAFIHHTQVKLDQVVSSEGYRKYPPKIIIYEGVERRLYRRIQSLADVNVDAMASSVGPLSIPSETEYQMPVIPRDAAAKPPQVGVYQKEFKPRNIYFSSFNERMAETIHILKLQSRLLLHPEQSRALAFDLKDDAPSLFSSNDQEHILIYIDDIQFRDQWRKNQDRFDEALRNAKSLATLNGYTQFVPLIFPDKLTVYADYMADSQWQDTSLISHAATVLGMPRLDERYMAMVSDGVRDIYLPNDSHTGTVGNVAAAEEILAFLESPR